MTVNYQNLEPNVDLIKYNDKEIFLVGTAHVSAESSELVIKIIERERPDSVAVELCQARYDSLLNPDRWKETDIVKIIREGKSQVLIAQLLLASFQKRIAKELNVKPGGEMMAALESAKKVGAELVLADRDVKATLKRAWHSLGFWSSLKVLAGLLGGIIEPKKIDKADIERLKSGDALQEVMQEFSDSLPKLRYSLVDERDQYLTYKIRQAQGKKIVAIVGAGHVPGMLKLFESPIDIKKLEELPKTSYGKQVGWIFLIIVFGLIIWGFFHSGAELSFEMLKAWFWVTGFCAAIGSALALGHPLTVLAAFVSAPFTTLHPILASGFVSGLVEASIRKPRVVDFENISDDIFSFKRFFKNRLCRILLVLIMTNIFGAIGMIYGVSTIAGMLP